MSDMNKLSGVGRIVSALQNAERVTEVGFHQDYLEIGFHGVWLHVYHDYRIEWAGEEYTGKELGAIDDLGPLIEQDVVAVSSNGSTLLIEVQEDRQLKIPFGSHSRSGPALKLEGWW